MLNRQPRFEMGEELRKNGGFSVNQGLEPPTSKDGRYMVSYIGLGIYTNVKSLLECDTQQSFLDFLRDEQAREPQKNLFFGGWVADDGHVHIDISEAIDDYQEAIAAAKINLQKAIYDVATDTTIYI